MGAGAWLVLASLFLSLMAVALFMVWLDSPEDSGDTLLVLCAVCGLAAVVAGIAGLYTQVPTAAKVIVMVVATIVAMLYIIVHLFRSIAAGLG